MDDFSRDPSLGESENRGFVVVSWAIILLCLLFMLPSDLAKPVLICQKLKGEREVSNLNLNFNCNLTCITKVTIGHLHNLDHN